MLLATAVKGMLETRNALQEKEGVSMPTYISEQIQILAQYTAAVEQILADDESSLEKKQAAQFKEYIAAGKSVNMATNLLKYDFSDERAEIIKLTRYTGSSWRLIGVGQSRIKHLIAESINQI